ncbi:MAG: hypothetical protein ACTSUV_04945 [Candidatus Ranarchaeia archaeon]
MTIEYKVPFCPECGGPLSKWPLEEEPTTCDFCNCQVFGKKDSVEQLEEEYNIIYKEFLLVSREFPDTTPVGDDVRIFRVPIKGKENNFDVLVVLKEYPERISIDYPRGLQNLIGPSRLLTTLESWVPNQSKPIDALREIFDKLNQSKTKDKTIFDPSSESWETVKKQFQVESISENKKRVHLYTPRTHFELNFMIIDNDTSVNIDLRLKSVLPDSTELEERYNNGEISLLDFLGRLEYEINTQDRIITEIQLLRNNFTNLKYYPDKKQIIISIPVGVLLIKIQVNIPPKFPLVKPEISIISEIKDKKIKDTIDKRKNIMLNLWNRHMHILDIISEIQASAIAILFERK